MPLTSPTLETSPFLETGVGVEEKFIVVYNVGAGGARASWKKTPTRHGEANKSYEAPQGSVSYPVIGNAVVVEAATEKEAAEAAALAYGKGTVTGKSLVVRKSAVNAVSPQ